MQIPKRLRAIIKQRLGRLAILAFPGRARVVEQNMARADRTLLDRMLRFGLIQRTDDHDRISGFHHRSWAGEQGGAFAEKCGGRFRSWFLTSHLSIVEELEKRLLEKPGAYNQLYEIGCGDGQVIDYLATRLKEIGEFVGIDINEQVVSRNTRQYQRANLRFVSGNAVDWIHRNGRSHSVFFTNGGVLEYFSEQQLTELLRKTAADLKPALFAIVEPVAPDHDMETETNSRPHGAEWSFTHNYGHLFRANGFTIRYQHETRTDGFRWVLMLAECCG